VSTVVVVEMGAGEETGAAARRRRSALECSRPDVAFRSLQAGAARNHRPLDAGAGFEATGATTCRWSGNPLSLVGAKTCRWSVRGRRNGQCTDTRKGLCTDERSRVAPTREDALHHL
jgi:hypothetical protein